MNDNVIAIIAPFCGIFVGTLLVARGARWVATLIGGPAKNKDGTPARVSSAVHVARLFLHSGPWLLAGVGWWAWAILSRPHSSAWNWFFGAAFGVVPAWIAYALWIARRARRRHSAGG